MTPFFFDRREGEPLDTGWEPLFTRTRPEDGATIRSGVREWREPARQWWHTEQRFEVEVDGEIVEREEQQRSPEGRWYSQEEAVKLYFAGPLFSAAERSWNAELAAALRDGGHTVFLPQEQEPDMDAAGIFGTDVGGIDGADVIVAIMDGPDPDSGTAWECGYAFGKKPIVLVRTDLRAQSGSGAPYNAMLSESATIRLDLPVAPMARVIAEVLAALDRLEEPRQ